MLGILLRAWRRENRIGIREAAPIVGISAPTLSRIENGHSVDQSTMMILLNWLFQSDRSEPAAPGQDGEGLR